MVLLHVKRGDESQFLLQAPGSTELEELTVQVARIYNARLKVQRLCSGGPRGAASLGGRDCGARAGHRGLLGRAGPGREKKRGPLGPNELGGTHKAFSSRLGVRVKFASICEDVQ